MLRRRQPRTQPEWFQLAFYPKNYVPLAVSYAISMILWGLVTMTEAEVLNLQTFTAFQAQPMLWSLVTIGCGVLQLTGLFGCTRRYLYLISLLCLFLWGWINVGLFLAVGHITTAQAMYTPATIASAWLVIRTAPIRW